MKLKYIIPILVAGLLISCKKTEDLVDFTEADEIMLGERLSQFVEDNATYFIIPEEGNSILYGYANSRLQEIVSSSHISKGEEFQWQIVLYESDTRHAFAHPGGRIYISTGMIFYLENEDQFSGLIAHLVAQINQSHISERLFFKYGVNGLKSIAQAGGDESIAQIIEDLDLSDDFISFSRVQELQADTLAISLLSETTQSCESAGLFHSRVLNVQPNQLSAYITAHRLTQERVDNINTEVEVRGCNATVDDESSIRYRSFRNSVP